MCFSVNQIHDFPHYPAYCSDHCLYSVSRSITIHKNDNVIIVSFTEV